MISPLLANIYCTTALISGLTAGDGARPKATWSSCGTPTIWSSASSGEDDARRFLDAMRTLLEEFSLSLHPDKTRLIEFGRHAAAKRKGQDLDKPETFKFLGFTFICGKSRRGAFQLKRKTRPTACGRSSWTSRRSYGAECTIQSRNKGNG